MRSEANPATCQFSRSGRIGRFCPICVGAPTRKLAKELAKLPTGLTRAEPGVSVAPGVNIKLPSEPNCGFRNPSPRIHHPSTPAVMLWRPLWCDHVLARFQLLLILVPAKRAAVPRADIPVICMEGSPFGNAAATLAGRLARLNGRADGSSA